ncbi:hypothetical protein Pan216_11990 [Planctomycetes bacterium Pan216]|uniref:Uncharacterized protein n=1 Tax=Kolteria novifilia TaxID=2527975 RepID=A0A518B061_9BACT|nr:hypothetical protein Pan216_11990 [Planctomycetes bacterium Pan216]
MRSFATCLVAASLGLWITGCGEHHHDEDAKATSKADDHDDHGHGHSHDHGHDQEHDHGAHGPHEGELLELGDSGYHAEFVDDPPATKIYLLGKDAKSPLEADVTGVTINVKSGDKAKQFTLKADAKGGDKLYISDDAELTYLLGSDDADARVRVDIGEKSYVAELHLDEHDEHDDHDEEAPSTKN